MRNPGGYLIVTSDSGMKEYDTFTCFHCNHIVVIAHGSTPEAMGGSCKICNKLICPKCVDLGACSPFEEKLKKIEDHDRFLRQLQL